MSTDCDICAENYNRSNRLPITCSFCEYNACRSCCEIWVVSENIAHCMNTTCRKEWSRKFLVKNFTKKFMSITYKNHREKILLDEQRALLPATQPLVERQIEYEHISDEMEVLNKQIHILYAQQNTLRTKRNTVERRATNERRVFVRACPDEECRGFLSTQWKCGICEKWTCNKCHDIIGVNNETEHTCVQANVDTAELLNKDTKSCPTCGVGIYKIEGCDQMFCTMCHTAFSWRTGRIETHIHNPHYYELMRRMGGNIERNQNEVICGREINNAFTRQLVREMSIAKIPSSQSNYITDICRIVIHNQYDLMPRYHVDHVLNHQGLRVAYLRKFISEKEFQISLQRTDKKTKVKREIYDIMNVVHNAVTDILYRYFDMIMNVEIVYELLSDEKKSEMNILVDEIPHIIKYANECFNDVATTYGTVRKGFDNELRWM
jgi:hypothetical protein